MQARSYREQTQAESWEEIWEAGSYYQRIAEHLENAERYALIAGWQLDSRVRLPRPGREGHGWETFKEKLNRLCERRPSLEIFLLMWDYSVIYSLEREPFPASAWADAHPRVHLVYDDLHPKGACHHEKICIIDGRVALCGGIDICGDRWDEPDHRYHHPLRSISGEQETHGPYHDLAVQVTGPVIRVLQRHLTRRWSQLSARPVPPVPDHIPENTRSGTAHHVYFSRTVGSASESSPRLIREVEFLFQELIELAEFRLILEGQYYWSELLNEALVRKLRQMSARGNPFELVVIVTDLTRSQELTRYMAREQLELLEKLRQVAEETRTRLTLGTPESLPPRDGMPARAVYIHSKVIVVDDRFLSIGSANFAERALRLDTEVQLTLEARTPAEREHVRRFAEGLLAHWNQPGLRLRPIEPRREIALLKGIYRVKQLKPVFDPPVPWLFRPRFRLRGERLACALAAFLILAWVGRAAVVGRVSGLAALDPDLAWVAALALGSVGWLPVPFVLLTLALELAVGWRIAFLTAASSLVLAGIELLVVSRVFPTTVALAMRKTSGLHPPHRRRWSVHSRLVQRIITPSSPRWFALEICIILPAILYVLCRLSGFVVEGILWKNGT